MKEPSNRSHNGTPLPPQLERLIDIAAIASVGYIAMLFVSTNIFGISLIPRNVMIVTALIDVVPAVAGILWLIKRYVAPKLTDNVFANPRRLVLLALLPAAIFILLRLIADITFNNR